MSAYSCVFSHSATLKIYQIIAGQFSGNLFLLLLRYENAVTPGEIPVIFVVAYGAHKTVAGVYGIVSETLLM